MFSCLCGDSAYPSIVLGTTKWPPSESPAGPQAMGAEIIDSSPRDQAERRFSDLENDFWGDLIGLGSMAYRIDTTESALQLVRSILDKLELTTEGGELVLHIQKEVVDEGKAIPQTKRGNMWEPAEGRKNRYAKAVQKQLEEMDQELAELANTKNTFSRVGRSFGRLATRVF